MMISIRVNSITETIEESTAFTLRDLRTSGDTTVILNGYAVEKDRVLREGDEVFLIPKGTLPPQKELEAMMAARHTPGIQQKLREGRVAIAGLGGLGSHIAVNLARLGVGYLRLIDFDLVEPSNLNRQHYLIRHLGRYKTEAMREQIAEINPFITVDLCTTRMTEENIGSVLSGCSIVCEAFDLPEAKAMLVNHIMCTRTQTKMCVIASSGMAGAGSGNEIRTVRKMDGFYLCGDFQTEAKEGTGLMAPRVTICAGHQANMVLRLLTGEEAP